MSSAPAAVLVTGASRGLGRGVALALAREGMSVAIHYGSNRAAAEVTRGACRQAAPRSEQRFVVVGGNIAGTEDRARILEEALAAFGRLDALVNNAGMAPRVRADILEAGEESFDELMAVNLKGPYFLSQAVARGLQARVRVVDLRGDGLGEPGRLLRVQGGARDGGEALGGPARRRGRPGLRGEAGDHGHGHDDGREGEVRPPDRGRPGPAGALGHGRGRGP